MLTNSGYMLFSWRGETVATIENQHGYYAVLLIVWLFRVSEDHPYSCLLAHAVLQVHVLSVVSPSCFSGHVLVPLIHGSLLPKER